MSLEIKELRSEKISKRLKGNKNRAKMCIIFGVIYNMISDAAEKLKTTRYFITKKLNDINNPHYLYLYKQ